MADKLDDMKLRLAELMSERAQLDAAIEEMIADMAELPPEQRSASDWAPDGVAALVYDVVRSNHALRHARALSRASTS